MLSKRTFTLCAVLFYLSTASAFRTDYSPEALKDEITNLPGLSPSDAANYRMFSGYITVDKENNRNIFYWFIEALKDSETKPLVTWSNGGPGCSGLSGLLTEQGPFRPTADGQLTINEFSWVNDANMVFYEAPAGVGFSYSDVPSDYITDDQKTARDARVFIQGWLEKFPNYQSHDLYITSESYGGHYMPTLAKEIVENNKMNKTINLKGIFVGNPYTDPDENEKGMYDTWYGHQLVSYPTWNEWVKECDNGDKTSASCDSARARMNKEVGLAIDPYALDFPVCNPVIKPTATHWAQRIHFMKHVIQDALHRPVPGIYGQLVKKYEADPEANVTDYSPCGDQWATKYLNEKDVQAALHAQPTKWAVCTGKIDYSAESMATPMEPVWKWLIANAPELRMTIVSGDDDSVCGGIGTQSWLWNMNFTVAQDWSAWYDKNGQTGGYVTKFKDALNYVTVHTAGHMIPSTQPQRSLITFQKYLAGEI